MLLDFVIVSSLCRCRSRPCRGLRRAHNVSASTASRSPDSVLSGRSECRSTQSRQGDESRRLQRAMNSGSIQLRRADPVLSGTHSALNPKLHAVITTNPDAVSEARGQRSAPPRGQDARPIDGISVLLKDKHRYA